MGLAISLVSQVPEKVWFHGEWCKSRGRNCQNTRLTSNGGCCMWYNEPQLLSDIEEHLGVTIQQVAIQSNFLSSLTMLQKTFEKIFQGDLVFASKVEIYPSQVACM
jgi:hypothetical protein